MRFIGRNAVSQRELQRCFNLVEYFLKRRSTDNKTTQNELISCIALSIALIYYFRLPTEDDNAQRNDHQTPSREEFNSMLSSKIPDFNNIIDRELKDFVNRKNFSIPSNVAINQAVRITYFIGVL